MVTYTLTATRLLGYQVKRLHHWRQQLFVIITINANTKLKITEYQILKITKLPQVIENYQY